MERRSVNVGWASGDVSVGKEIDCGAMHVYLRYVTRTTGLGGVFLHCGVTYLPRYSKVSPGENGERSETQRRVIAGHRRVQGGMLPRYIPIPTAAIQTS